MALGLLQDCNWEERGWQEMSFFVCFLYASNATPKIVSKSEGGVSVCKTWDMRIVVEGLCLVCWLDDKRIRKRFARGADPEFEIGQIFPRLGDRRSRQRNLNNTITSHTASMQQVQATP